MEGTVLYLSRQTRINIIRRSKDSEARIIQMGGCNPATYPQLHQQSIHNVLQGQLFAQRQGGLGKALHVDVQQYVYIRMGSTFQNMDLMKTLRNNMVHKMFNARAKEA